MEETLTFNDVLIKPKFSEVRSRKDVSLKTDFLGLNLTLPIISSNMDSVTGPEMAAAMALNGAVGALHRFSTIEENVDSFYKTMDIVANTKSLNVPSSTKPIVSVGVGDEEFRRAVSLVEAGAKHLILDVAHAANIAVVDQYNRLRNYFYNDVKIIVGNFATEDSIREFNKRVTSKKLPDAVRVSVGSGSACSTRIVTGCGVPSFSTLVSCVSVGIPVIFDGGCKTSGDIAKALAAGASLVMLGNMLAGTDESSGEFVGAPGAMDDLRRFGQSDKLYKVYRGSASKESYEAQGKVAEWRAPEGEAIVVPCSGPVKDTLQQIEGGIRSAMSYVGAHNLEEFRKNSEFIKTTNNGYVESTPHGKKND